jgi:ketosteroid isomerase-like protein
LTNRLIETGGFGKLPGGMPEPSGVNQIGSEPAIRQTIDAYFDCINHERWDRLAELFSADAELRAVGARPRMGRDDIGTYFREALGPYPEHRDEPTRIIPAGQTVTVEIHFEGRLANGRPLAFDAVDVFDFRGDRIQRLTSWYDSAQVRRDLRNASAGVAAETG